MRYMGGKNRTGSYIADFLIRVADRTGLSRIEDRCCGSLAVSRFLFDRNYWPALGVDVFEPLIRCFERVRDGWDPPEFISDEIYWRYAAIWRKSANRGQRAQRDPKDPMVAFAGIFSSYAGKFFTGPCPDDERFEFGTPARHASVASSRDLIAMRPMLRSMDLRVGECFDFLPRDPSILYFDPPYAETTPYAWTPPFDSVSFWRVAAELSDEHAIVVSEFTAPDDWIVAHTFKCGAPGLLERGAKGCGSRPKSMGREVGDYTTKSERLFVRRGGRVAKALRLG